MILNEVLVWSNQLSYSQKASRLLGTHTLPSFVLLQPWFMLLWSMVISKAMVTEKETFPGPISWTRFSINQLMKLLRQLSTVSAMKNNQYILGIETNSTYIGLVVERSIVVQIQPYNLFRGSLEFQQIRKKFPFQWKFTWSLAFRFDFAFKINKTSFFKTRHLYRTFHRTQI